MIYMPIILLLAQAMRVRGHCKDLENSTIAVERTFCNRTNNAEAAGRLQQQWLAFHKSLVAEAGEYRPLESGRSRLLLVGDSISEALRGTAIGKVFERTKGHNETLRDFDWGLADLAKPPMVLAISGDETEHLLWRLEDGEISPRIAADPNLWINLLIGTNNICNVNQHSGEETADGVRKVAELLLRRTAGRLLINMALPRDRAYSRPGRPVGTPKGWPFMPRLTRMNEVLQSDVLPALTAQYAGRVRTVSCGQHFLPHGKGANRENIYVNFTLMPDGTHPTPDGSLIMATCISDALRAWHTELQLV